VERIHRASLGNELNLLGIRDITGDLGGLTESAWAITACVYVVTGIWETVIGTVLGMVMAKLILLSRGSARALTRE
jgi:hypothetical protein